MDHGSEGRAAQPTAHTSEITRIDLISQLECAPPGHSGNISHHAVRCKIAITLQTCSSTVERATGIEPA